MNLAKIFSKLWPKRDAGKATARSNAPWYITKRCQPQETGLPADNQHQGAKILMLENSTRHNYPKQAVRNEDNKGKAGNETTSSIVIKFSIEKSAKSSTNAL